MPGCCGGGRRRAMLRLVWSHSIAGVLHLASAITLAVLSADYDGTRNIYLLRESWAPQGNETDCSEVKCVTSVETGEPYPFSLSAAATFFGFWSGIMHLVAAWTVRDVSNEAIDRDVEIQFRLRRIRFFDYAVTAGRLRTRSVHGGYPLTPLAHRRPV